MASVFQSLLAGQKEISPYQLFLKLRHAEVLKFIYEHVHVSTQGLRYGFDFQFVESHCPLPRGRPIFSMNFRFNSMHIKLLTRSYYRKENAASPPRAGTICNLLNKGQFMRSRFARTRSVWGGMISMYWNESQCTIHQKTLFSRDRL
jgi:hypothetical protein